MKLHTPEGNELMEVYSVKREGDVLVVRAVIMGTMPTRAVLRPEELRRSFRLLSWGLICSLFGLLLRKPGTRAG